MMEFFVIVGVGIALVVIGDWIAEKRRGYPR